MRSGTVTEAALATLMAPREGADGTIIFLFNIFAIIAIFYFLLIRPQRKERERHEQMIRAVQKGDEVVTSGGIIGTVIRAEEDRLIIKTGGDTRVTVERARVSRKLGGEEAKR